MPPTIVGQKLTKWNVLCHVFVEENLKLHTSFILPRIEAIESIVVISHFKVEVVRTLYIP